MKYVKRPIQIEAVRFTGVNLGEIEKFVGGDTTYFDGALHIVTLEGVMRALVNDFIIKGIGGEFYPCKPDIFAATYNLVTESPSDKVTESPSYLQAIEEKRIQADEDYRELCFLRHFYQEADFGPADGDVRCIIRDSYLGPVPEGYRDEE